MINTSKAIIFIPGFKGSVLSAQQGQMVWPHFFWAQFQRKSLMINHFDSTNTINYYPSDVVKAVPVIPGLFAFDVYGAFLQRLTQQLPDYHLDCFAYDWRDDLICSARQLVARIETLKAQGYTSISIIAHSMGGLISSYALQTLNFTPEKLFLLGVPFHGAIKTFIDTINGSSLGYNKTLTNADAMASFPSVYYLLPRDFTLKLHHDDGIETLKLHDVSAWQRHHWGIFNAADSIDIQQQKAEFLQRCFDNVANFYKRVYEQTPAQAMGELILINAKHYSTLERVEVKKAKHGLDITHMGWTRGDGSVTNQAMTLPPLLNAWPRKELAVSATHAYVFKNRVVQDTIIDALS